MTQKERIFNRLKTGEWLSSVEASRNMYIMRLGARIFDLCAEGHNIIERKVAGKSYSEYKLLPPQAPMMPPAFPELKKPGVGVTWPPLFT
jgi:Helix-turn-helix domain